VLPPLPPVAVAPPEILVVLLPPAPPPALEPPVTVEIPPVAMPPGPLPPAVAPAFPPALEPPLIVEIPPVTVSPAPLPPVANVVPPARPPPPALPPPASATLALLAPPKVEDAEEIAVVLPPAAAFPPCAGGGAVPPALPPLQPKNMQRLATAETPTRSRDLCLELIILDEQFSHLARPHERNIPSRPSLPDPARWRGIRGQALRPGAPRFRCAGRGIMVTRRTPPALPQQRDLTCTPPRRPLTRPHCTREPRPEDTPSPRLHRMLRLFAN